MATVPTRLCPEEGAFQCDQRVLGTPPGPCFARNIGGLQNSLWGVHGWDPWTQRFSICILFRIPVYSKLSNNANVRAKALRSTADCADMKSEIDGEADLCQWFSWQKHDQLFERCWGLKWLKPLRLFLVNLRSLPCSRSWRIAAWWKRKLAQSFLSWRSKMLLPRAPCDMVWLCPLFDVGSHLAWGIYVP